MLDDDGEERCRFDFVLLRLLLCFENGVGCGKQHGAVAPDFADDSVVLD